MDTLSLPVLVLNRFFEPIQVTNAQRGLVLLYGGAALAVEDGDLYDFPRWRSLPARVAEGVGIVGGELRVPRVLHLLRYDRTPKTAVRLSRKNLMLRDGFQCQYCGKRPSVRDLNIDHVLPRSRRGASTWENLVTACRSCNLGKGSLTPEEAGLALLRKPARPRWTTSTRIRMGQGPTFPEWEPFLQTG